MSGTANGKRALVVDDASTTRTLLCKFLSKDGFVCTEAASGEEALQKFNVEKPDLVTLDIHMDQLSGMGVLQVMRKMDPKVSIIVVSCETEKHIIAEILRLGAKAVVSKPFTSEELNAAIERAL